MVEENAASDQRQKAALYNRAVQGGKTVRKVVQGDEGKKQTGSEAFGCVS
ncbi:MAG: hypothetical protein WCI01_10300 [Chlorobiaceae bacterium]